jgi:Kdo2-lipid IVA lauroyltransferase/acyltransferase
LTERKGTWLDWLAYLCLRCVICLIHCASLESCDRVCRLLAFGLADWAKLRRKVIDANLQIAYGQLMPDQLSFLRREMWHHLLLMICEIAHAPRKIHWTNWREHVYMPDKDQMLRELLDDRATVLVTGHFGNFEVAGYTTGLLGIHSSTVARPLDNVYVDAYVEAFRSATGQFILPKDGSAKAIQELLERKGTLTILADQHGGPKGSWVEFFGHATSCHKALALFVLSARAPMVVTYARRLDRPLRFEIGMTGLADPDSLDLPSPPAYLNSVDDLTKWYNEKLEEAIRLAPEQYWWLHRRWREVPANIQKRLAARRAK